MSTTTTTKKPKKQPADHAPKKPKGPKVEQVPGGTQVTLQGVTVTIVHEAFDDWELLEALGELDGDNPRSIAILPGLLKRALAPGDSIRVMDVLRDPVTKRVPLAAGVQFVLELFKAANPSV